MRESNKQHISHESKRCELITKVPPKKPEIRILRIRSLKVVQHNSMRHPLLLDGSKVSIFTLAVWAACSGGGCGGRLGATFGPGGLFAGFWEMIFAFDSASFCISIMVKRIGPSLDMPDLRTVVFVDTLVGTIRGIILHHADVWRMCGAADAAWTSGT